MEQQHKNIAIEELARGQECANKLKELLKVQSFKFEVEAGDGAGSECFKYLTEGVLKSFTNTLSILKYLGDLDEVSQITIGGGGGGGGGGSSLDCSRSEESEDSSKFSSLKVQRGCKNRRKNTYARYVDSPNWNTDGHAWRKYGQKNIHKSIYPRNYFRCTHKNEQGCQATKQVQRIQEDPPLYRTTYFGQHTCRNLQNDPKLVFDDVFAEEGNSKLLISFSNKNANTNGSTIFPSFQPITTPSEEPPSPSDVNQKPSSSSPDYYVPSDIPEFDHNPAGNFSQTSADHCSLIDNVMMMGPAEFDDLCTLQEYCHY